MSEIYYTNIMLEFEKLTTKLDKLEKEVAEFKKSIYPNKQFAPVFKDNIRYALSDGSLVDSGTTQTWRN